MARRVGLDAIALTEHFHAYRYWEIYDHLRTACPELDGLYRVDGLLVLPGAEINIRERGHIVVLGRIDDLARLDRAFRPRLSEGHEPAFRELLDVTDQLDVVRIAAHMFRPGKGLWTLPFADLRRVDALELNGKDFTTEARVHGWAARLDLPVVGGSDAHHWLQLGVRHSILDLSRPTAAGILDAFRGGAVTPGGSPFIPLRVKAATSMKRVRKLLRAA